MQPRPLPKEVHVALDKTVRIVFDQGNHGLLNGDGVIHLDPPGDLHQCLALLDRSNILSRVTHLRRVW